MPTPSRPSVRPEPWGSPLAERLVDELAADLTERYGATDDADPEVDAELAVVRPADVAPPRGAFLVVWLDGGGPGTGDGDGAGTEAEGHAGEVAGGCGAIRPSPFPGTAEVKRMYVRRAARGRGAARALLAALEDEARRLGYHRMVLETGVQQPEAMALYESAGYTPIEAYGAYRASGLSRCYERPLV